jgi:hypothetical protein
MCKKLTRYVLCALFGLALVACGSSSSGVGGPCTVSLDCPQGQVCGETETCLIVECSAQGQCKGPSSATGAEICAVVECNGSSVCTSVECGVNTGANGEATEALSCLDGESCVANAYFEAIDSNGGICRVNDNVCTAVGIDAGGDSSPPTCPGIPCGAGTTCDAASGTCVPAVNDFVCSPCSGDAECGGANDICSPFTGGSFCTEACSTEADCPVGYTCYEITNNAKQCVPYSYNCSGCIVDGCPADQVSTTTMVAV